MSGRPRVAHAPSGTNASLLADLAQKRKSLAVVSARVNSGIVTKKSNSQTPIKRRKPTFDEDEDFIEKDDSAESEDSFVFSDEEFEEPIRKKVAVSNGTKTRPVSNLSTQSSISTSSKQRTLSESSGEDSGEWLGKTSSGNKKMETRVVEPKVKRKITVTTFSDEDESEEENSRESMPKREKKRVIISSDEEVQEEDSDHRETTPDSDSEAEERRRYTRRETHTERQSREFFNTATKEDLVANAKVSEKVALAIMEKRPFTSFVVMEDALGEIAHGKKALDNYQEHAENRGVLEQILIDCGNHADAVEEGFQQCTQTTYQPKLLTPGYNLHDYQKVGLNWLIMMNKKNFNCILGDEMGLGKTIQIVAFLAWLKEEGIHGPHLVVVPSSTIENWMGELRRWCNGLRVETYYGSQEERKELRKRAKKRKDQIDVILTTYNMIGSKSDDKKFFKSFSMNYVIYDEGHLLKNCATDRYKNLMKVKGKRKILLTGTPLQNNLIELISLMYFVLSKVFQQYCEDITQLLGHFKALGPGLQNSSANLYRTDRIEQAKLILQPYILRRLKSQVLTLPPKEEEVVEVEMLKKQADNYENVINYYARMSSDAGTQSATLMKLRQAANHPLLTRIHYTDATLLKIAKTLCSKEKPYEKKIPKHVAEDLAFSGDFQIHQICEKFKSTKKFLLDEDLVPQSGKCKELDARLPKILEKKEKVLIFSQFTMMLDILQIYCRVRGYKFLRLDGQTPVLERQELINQFNVDDQIYIFLLSTKAGGLGINLTSANHIIIHDIDFNPYNDKQAEDRCHRMGQKKPVYVTRLISKGSVESGIYSLNLRKLKLEKDVTVGIKGQIEEEDEATRDSNDSDENKLSAQDIDSLLKGAVEHKGIE